MEITHEILKRYVKEGDFCIDATVGNGHDTVFLAKLCGESGKVLGFDIQPQAVENTLTALKNAGLEQRAEIIQASHTEISRYAKPESAAAAVFNFGWLPGGDHNIFTKSETSLEAIKQALCAVKPGGIVCLAVYYGKQCGYTERDDILSLLKSLDSAEYTVILMQFYNRINNPSIPAFIIKNEKQALT